MARTRRSSAALAAARQRLAGLNKIIPIPNLGPNITVLAYQGVITTPPISRNRTITSTGPKRVPKETQG